MSTTADQQYNIDLANRQIEINEWTYENKMETVFVFQLLFIALLITTIVMALKRMGYFGGAFAWYVVGLIVLVMAIIIFNRANYTNKYRDRRFWNRRRFPQDNAAPSPVARGDASYQEYIDQVRSNFGESGRTGTGASCRCS